MPPNNLNRSHPKPANSNQGIFQITLNQYSGTFDGRVDHPPIKVRKTQPGKHASDVGTHGADRRREMPLK